MSRVVWITASPRDPATGAVVTVRLAGGGSVTPYHRDGNHYRAGLANQPRFSAELGFDRNGWSGGTVPATGNLVFRPAQSSLLNELAGHHWRDASIAVESGPEGGPYSAVLTGVVADMAIADHAMTLVIADLSFAIDKPVVSARFAGNGGAEGGSEAAGRVKRRSWGRVFNIEGRVLDKATNVYEFGDPAFPWQQFDALRDIGRAAAPAPAVLAWAGSVAATLTALKASAPALGSGVVAPSIACAKWWAQPVGPLTADVRGEVGAGYVETAPEIAASIAAAVAGPAIANVSAMAAIRAGAAGLHIGDETETAAQALDRLLLGVSLLWILEPAGTIRLREWTFASPVETLISHKVTRLKSFAPVRTRRLGYQRSHRIHSDAEIAAVLIGLDPEAGAKLDGIETVADVTTETVVTPETIFSATHTGTVKAAEFSKTIVARLFRQGSQLTAGVSWTYKVLSGTVNGFSSASAPQAMAVENGAGSLVVNSLAGDAEVEIIPTYAAAARQPKRSKLVRRLDPPPSSGGSGGGSGGTASTKSVDGSASSTTPVVLATFDAITIGSAGQATLSAQVTVSAAAASPIGGFAGLIVFQRNIAGTWTDAGGGTDSGTATVDYEPPYTASDGNISVDRAETGLTIGSTPSYRLVGYRGSNSPAKTISFAGTATVQG